MKSSDVRFLIDRSELYTSFKVFCEIQVVLMLALQI